jgi:hypothetical protein
MISPCKWVVEQADLVPNCLQVNFGEQQPCSNARMVTSQAVVRHALTAVHQPLTGHSDSAALPLLLHTASAHQGQHSPGHVCGTLTAALWGPCLHHEPPSTCIAAAATRSVSCRFTGQHAQACAVDTVQGPDSAFEARHTLNLGVMNFIGWDH